MTRAQEQNQTPCECCGAERRLQSHYGKQVCPTCAVVRGAAKKNPGLLLDAVLELAPEVMPAPVEAEPAAESPALRAELARCKEQLVEILMITGAGELADPVAAVRELCEKFYAPFDATTDRPSADAALDLAVWLLDNGIYGFPVELFTRLAGRGGAR